MKISDVSVSDRETFNPFSITRERVQSDVIISYKHWQKKKLEEKQTRTS